MIETIDKNAFYGLSNLKRILLYENKIKNIEVGTFSNLMNLEILFLNSNQIQCVQHDLFSDLAKLTILSLYDNQLDTLPRGLFTNNKNLETLHLASNEWNCDCKMRWLIEYFEEYKDRQGSSRSLEASGAKCSPKSSRLIGGGNDPIELSDLSPPQLKCARGAERIYSQCEKICPNGCTCDASSKTVDCKETGLYRVPEDLPVYTEKLILSGNQIKEMPGWISKFPIVELDLSQNQIGIKEEFDFLRFIRLNSEKFSNFNFQTKFVFLRENHKNDGSSEF